MGSEDAPAGLPAANTNGFVGMSAVEETDLYATFAAQGKEVERAAKHLQASGRIGFTEAVSLLISFMGTNRAKEMNDFWDERGGI